MDTDIAMGVAADIAVGTASGIATDAAMDVKLAMRQRHTVRKFTSEPLSPELISQLNDRVRANNERFGLAISLKVGDESALPGALKLFFAKGVRNYFVLAGSDRPGLDEDLGYASADLMLFAQTLGLNTWWIGGTFSRKNVERAVPGEEGHRHRCCGLRRYAGRCAQEQDGARGQFVRGSRAAVVCGWRAGGASSPDGAQQAVLPNRRRRQQGFH